MLVTDAFKLWSWSRLLRVPWTARISNQSILKEISPEYSLEGPMLKIKPLEVENRVFHLCILHKSKSIQGLNKSQRSCPCTKEIILVDK